MNNKERRKHILQEESQFVEVAPQWVRSSKGFYVGPRGRFEIEYREGDHVLIVPVEPGPSALGIELSSAKAWVPPHDEEEISSEKRRQIASNIAAAMKRLRTGFEIV